MIRLSAPAKINLFLEITGRRPDGFHTLSTIFQTISLADCLSFSAAEDLALTCSDRSLPVDSRNLVMKAALRLQEALREPRGAKIHLEKNIPMGAGLGGGSSDAACVMKGLLKLWKQRMAPKQMAQLAVKLGADVPFFLKGGLCEAKGIGEILNPLKSRPRTWLVLVYPGFGVSTKEAYAKVRLPFLDSASPGSPRRPPSPIGRGPAAWGEAKLFNRFESLVFPDHPKLPQLKQDLLDAGATGSLMSGSGSSVFGLAKSRAHGAKILSAVQKKYNQCWLVHTI